MPVQKINLSILYVKESRNELSSGFLVKQQYGRDE